MSYPLIYERITGMQHGLWKDDTFAALMALIVLVAAAGKRPARAVPRLAADALARCGELLMYLLHSIVLSYAARMHEAWGINKWLCLALAAVVLVAWCQLSLVAFEAPTRRAINAWGSRLVGRHGRRPMDPAPAATKP